MSNEDFSQSRRHMVDSQLRTSGIHQSWVLAAMGAAPRENFVPDSLHDIAYMDRSIQIAGGRALNPALSTAQILEAANVTDQDNILLIGAGSGYMASLLAQRAASIVAVEEDEALFALASANLNGITNIQLVKSALAAGAADKAPYKLIIIDGAIGILPENLVNQLEEGGRIVTGLADGPITRIAAGFKHGGAVALKNLADSAITPLSAFARKAEFAF